MSLCNRLVENTAIFHLVKANTVLEIGMAPRETELCQNILKYPTGRDDGEIM